MKSRLSSIKSIFIASCRKALKSYFKHKVIYDYREFLQGGERKKALVSYLVHPLLPPPAFREKVQFSNRGIAQEICRALNELGYAVDVIDYSNTSWLPTKQYDLFIGHGGHNFERISSKLADSTVKIYFSTGLYWRDLNVKEAARFYDLTLRRGVLLPADRHTSPDEETANQLADGIICLGNENVAASYSTFKNVHHINNATYPLQIANVNKQFDIGRKHFLFFSGRGNVHKGLDLLLESFVGKDLHLHICQHIEADFARVYKDELTNHPNIHNEGFVRMRSRHFEKLASECAWVILPSCAEGQPGSVLECMSYGLIPILSDECNIDLDAWGIRISGLDVEALSAAVIKASSIDTEECRLRSAHVSKAARLLYTPDIFRANFKKSVHDILTACQRSSV